jgi:hypothetical protein
LTAAFVFFTSFRRTPESSPFSNLQTTWTPASAGVTAIGIVTLFCDSLYEKEYGVEHRTVPTTKHNRRLKKKHTEASSILAGEAIFDAGREIAFGPRRSVLYCT